MHCCAKRCAGTALRLCAAARRARRSSTTQSGRRARRRPPPAGGAPPPPRRPSRRAQVVKHRADLATALVALGAAGALVDQVAEARGAARLPGVMALGFIGAFSETLALAVIAERGLARRPP